jgi:S1-C subfamily serine protease
MRPTIRLVLTTLLALELAIAGCGGSNSHAPRQTAATDATRAPARASSSDLTGLETQFIRVVARVSPSVVQISTDSGLGSGVVYDDRGDIVTNHHVVAGSRRFEVTLANGRRHPAALVGDFPPEDLAVIRLEGATPPAASLGDSSKLRVGQIAFAIGNPLGLRSSVTQGIVSSLGRTVSEGPGGGVVSSAVQTSAPINPGNSGGALVDLRGQLVGINTAIFSGSGGNIGIGFAIPSNMVRAVMTQLVQYGEVKRGMLGVQLSNQFTPDIAKSLGLDNARGAWVSEVVEGGAADKAGIKAGDVVTKVNDRVIGQSEDLAATVRSFAPGTKVTLTIERGNDTRTVNVTLGSDAGH